MRRRTRPPRTSATIALVGVLIGVLLAGCAVLDARDAAERANEPPPDAQRFERAEQGLGSGRVPEVADDCAIDQAAIETVREIQADKEQDGLDGPEQVALRQLVAAAADCPDAP